MSAVCEYSLRMDELQTTVDQSTVSVEALGHQRLLKLSICGDFQIFYAIDSL